MEQSLGVVFEDDLPLAYARLSAPMLPAERLRIEQANIELLRNLSVLDESSADRSDEPRDADLQRLEQKVNLLIELMARLIRFQAELPPSRRVRLSAAAIDIAGADDLAADEVVRVDVYLSPKLPRAIVLLGRVMKPATPTTPCTLLIEHGTQVLQDIWEKYIFRQHRRMIAIQRRAATSSSN